MQQAIKSQRVVTPDGVRPACVVFEDSRIVAVLDEAAVPSTVQVIEAGELYVLPGLVDSHIHINEPGRTEWEGFATASRAAVAGGYSCLVDMPLNSVPVTTTVEALERKREAASAARPMVDYAFWGGAVKGNSGDLLSLATAGARGFKCFLVDPGIDEFTMLDERELRLAMPIIAQTGLPLLVHAELPGPVLRAQSKLLANAQHWPDYATYLESRPDEAETAAIKLMIHLCREFQCPVHIVHLSSAEALPLLDQARSEGLPITVETCPHYLYFSAEEIPDRATQYKCAPPIRGASNREALWRALREGRIDLVATDHSPCPPELKQRGGGDFLHAWGGIASLSLALSAMWTAASRHGFEIGDIVRWMSEKPAELAGLGSAKGRIVPGCDADFVVFDPDAQWEVSVGDLHFRHALSPYLGERLKGKVMMTFVRGQRVYANGIFTNSPAGRESTNRASTV